MKKFLCLVITMLFAASAAMAGPRVYSNCYDGYLNVRSAPSSKSTIVGTLRNGPEGAELLGVEGSWSKVRVNGIVGYVFSSYLQSTPTDPVYVDVAAVIGDWYYINESLSIKSDGTFIHRLGSMITLRGTWRLSHSSIILKYSGSETIACDLNGNFLNVDGAKYHRL